MREWRPDKPVQCDAGFWYARITDGVRSVPVGTEGHSSKAEALAVAKKAAKEHNG